MGARKIKFELNGAEAVAVMREHVSPRTCEAVWNRLPISGKAVHAMWAGRELMLHLTGQNRMVLEQEGPVMAAQGGIDGLPYAQPFGVGRISYIHRAALQTRGVRKDYPTESQNELCEFAIYYGFSTPSMQDPGRRPQAGKEVSVWFATFEEPIPEDFISNADAMQYEGDKGLVVSQA